MIGLGQDREMWKFGGKRPLSRPRRKWDDIIEIGLQEMGCLHMDCIGLVQYREMGKVGGKRTLSRPKRKWDDFIEIDLQEMDVGVWTASGWVRIGTWGVL